MRASSSIGLGLSLVFGCLLLAPVAELYYLLWWKKRVTNREMIQESYSSPTRELFYMFCLKKPSSLTTDTLVHEPQVTSEYGNTDLWLSQFSQDQEYENELEHNDASTRFLFTIKEETKEDLESEDMSDVIYVDTPFFTPLALPVYFTPPITPGDYTYRTFSPLFESASDSEFIKIWASPPPKFKFLRDAKDKLQKKLMKRFDDDEDEDEDEDEDGVKDEENGSYITLDVSTGVFVQLLV
ncbi:uncharacterized protein [Rutidosis leptorrhynchoides]|uniref:uncharacterized protein n=1 Tax=Rutidosis leptorrhynchoides TaxID=125765 RepID=UPI003A990D34